MREIPILMSGPMAAATLEDQKNQTRRIMNKRNSLVGAYRWEALLWDDFVYKDGKPESGEYLHVRSIPFGGAWKDDEIVDRVYCRYKPGDRFWVKQRWGIHRRAGTDDWRQVGPGLLLCDDGGPSCVDRWRSSRFMPKKATKLWLEITAVRAEKVQEISETDVLAEGVPFNGVNWGWGDGFSRHDLAFRYLWDLLNAHRSGYSWANNPWIWCFEFRRLK